MARGAIMRIGPGFTTSNRKSGATGQVTGQMDQLSFWVRELTDQEIGWLYNGGSGRAHPFVTE